MTLQQEYPELLWTSSTSTSCVHPRTTESEPAFRQDPQLNHGQITIQEAVVQRCALNTLKTLTKVLYYSAIPPPKMLHIRLHTHLSSLHQLACICTFPDNCDGKSSDPGRSPAKSWLLLREHFSTSQGLQASC